MRPLHIPPDCPVNTCKFSYQQCDGVFPDDAQREWLAYAQRTGCDGANGEAMPFEMRRYFNTLYGLVGDESCAHVDPSELRFFWAFAPRRTSFAVVWAPAYCSYFGAGLLWGPIDDSLMSTRLVQTYDGADECCIENCEAGASGTRRYDDPCLAGLAQGAAHYDEISFPGFFVHRFAHEYLSEAAASTHWKQGLPDGAWVEVMRIDRIDLVSHDDTTTCTVGQIWLYLAPGSGIWYNVGRSKRALTTGEAAGLWYSLPTRPCTTARQEGFDSIQMTEFENGFSFEILDCRGADLPNFADSWDNACPPAHVDLRSGVPPKAQRWAPALEALPAAAEGLERCACNDAMWHLNCEG